MPLFLSSSEFPRPRLALLLSATALTALPAFAQESVTLDPVILQGQGSPISGGVGYTVSTTSTGLKSGAPLTEVPMTVNTVTEQELKDRDPVQIEDALAYIPGIVASPWGMDDRFDQFSIRGFDLGVYGLFRDGLINKAQSFSGFKVDPYMIQRIDVLKGPASVLYGSNDAAGMVNMITKRPTFAHLGEAKLSYGSHDTAELAVDWGDVNADKTLSWRLTGLTRDGANSIKNSDDDRDLLAFSTTWAPTDQTSITFLAHWQKDNMMPNVMVPVAGEDYDTSGGTLPSDFLNTQHPWNKFETEQASIGWQAEHEFNDSLKVRQNFRYARQTTDYNHLYSSGLVAGAPLPDSLNYTAFTVDEKARYWALDNQLEYRGRMGDAEHVLTFGVDVSKQIRDGSMGYADPGYVIALSALNFDQPVTEPGAFNDARTEVLEKGIYAQDHIRFGNGVTVTAGLRRSWVENETKDRLWGMDSAQKDNATTGMLGATWDLGNGFVPYASYGESFTVNIGQTFGGEQYKPTEGKQLEVGLRYQPEGTQLQLAAALYNIEKSNVLTSDPVNSGFQIQTGEVRHRGLELEARGQVTEAISLIAGYSYIDAKVLSSEDGDQGNEPAMVPEHSASIWAEYDFNGAAEGLSLGGGLRYVGKTWADNANSREVDSYVLADMAVHYTWDDYSVALNVTNLFDEEYYATCSAAGYGCAQGEGREATLTLSRAF
ncbi:TonB-dependent siderophore receptor [Paracoccus litorisediminis]|uniref:TonB-dependent siderophore receptor n=1 Tax=Paracoccus litorisediminis TaxID=2006130 RepID=A0A844HUL5_9RHOB|nr:TonB-dependent siderophore receptor [Paracoccus litorisediminis]MTH61261.1 TonB-dependent siderophore receptor [Paracoccus litorisediminis]